MGQFATSMHTNGYNVSVDLSANSSVITDSVSLPAQQNSEPLIVWDWDVEHKDRRREAEADAWMHGAQPFEVDRKILKDVVKEKMGSEVGRIKFISSGECGHWVTLIRPAIF